MESQPQNPKFRNNPENFHTCLCVRTRVCVSHSLVCDCRGFLSYLNQEDTNRELVKMAFYTSCQSNHGIAFTLGF